MREDNEGTLKRLPPWSTNSCSTQGGASSGSSPCASRCRPPSSCTSASAWLVSLPSASSGLATAPGWGARRGPGAQPLRSISWAEAQGKGRGRPAKAVHLRCEMGWACQPGLPDDASGSACAVSQGAM